MDKPKPGVGLLLLGKPKGEPDDDEGGMGGMGAKDAAADAIMSAIESKDKTALVDALSSFYDACSMGGDSE